MPKPVATAACDAEDRRVELRHFVDLPPALIEGEAISEHVQIVNIARRGFLARTRLSYCCGDPIRLHLEGRDPIEGRIVWAGKGMLGARFLEPVDWPDLTGAQQ